MFHTVWQEEGKFSFSSGSGLHQPGSIDVLSSLCAPMMTFPSSSFCQKQTQTELQKWVQTQETHHEHQQHPPVPMVDSNGREPWSFFGPLEGRKKGR